MMKGSKYAGGLVHLLFICSSQGLGTALYKLSQRENEYMFYTV